MIGTVIPQKRTAGGCGPRKSSKKMLRRRAQSKAKLRLKASGKMRPLPVKRAVRLLPDVNYEGAANTPPPSPAVAASANTARVIRRRTVW